jgi:hypothetical protein
MYTLRVDLLYSVLEQNWLLSILERLECAPQPIGSQLEDSVLLGFERIANKPQARKDSLRSVFSSAATHPADKARNVALGHQMG